jgi:alpha-ketoglutarate-dependent taurine dioxygenase
VAENGCEWRGLPKRFGNGHTIYTRMNRWAKAGVLDCSRTPQRLPHRMGTDTVVTELYAALQRMPERR